MFSNVISALELFCGVCRRLCLNNLRRQAGSYGGPAFVSTFFQNGTMLQFVTGPSSQFKEISQFSSNGSMAFIADNYRQFVRLNVPSFQSVDDEKLAAIKGK